MKQKYTMCVYCREMVEESGNKKMKSKTKNKKKMKSIKLFGTFLGLGSKKTYYENKIEALQGEITKILEGIAPLEHPTGESGYLHGIVSFLNFLAPYHEDNVFREVQKELKKRERKPSALAYRLDVLDALFAETGSTKYGLNRAKPGQCVTVKDVWLGNIDGLFTKTVEFWLKTEDLEAQAIVHAQAERFVLRMCNDLRNALIALDKSELKQVA